MGEEQIDKKELDKYIKKQGFWTVGKLKAELSKYPDDMVVGGNGHFGEYLQIYDVYKTNTSFQRSWGHEKPFGKFGDQIPMVYISIEDAGEPPDYKYQYK